MARLMQRQGFHGTGLNRVLADSSAPKGSLYFHFPGGKEQLAVEALRTAGDQLREGIEETLADAASPAEAVRLLARRMAVGLERSSFTDGCPVATTALEVSSSSEAIRDASGQALASWQEAIAARMRAFGWSETDSASFAVTVLAGLEGGLLLSRVRRDVTPLVTVGDHLARLAETIHRPGSSGT